MIDEKFPIKEIRLKESIWHILIPHLLKVSYQILGIPLTYHLELIFKMKDN